MWDEWQVLIHSDNPDLLEILKLGAQFQAYFSTIESETLQAARTGGNDVDPAGRRTGNEPPSRVAASNDVGRVTPSGPTGGSVPPR